MKCTFLFALFVLLAKKYQILANSGKWDTYSTGIYGPHGWNEKSLVIELGLVMDNSIYQTLNNDTNAVFERYRDMVYEINSHYKKFNIYVALVFMEIWTNGDMTNTNLDGCDFYNNFTPYAAALVKEKGYFMDTVQLVSNKCYTPCSNVGVICYEPVSVSSSCLMDKPTHMFAINFGLLMGLGITLETNCWFETTDRDKWCEHVSKDIQNNLTDWKKKFPCLNNKPSKLFGEPVCGNGYLEGGEECDCGSTESCDSQCCDAKTCRMIPDVPCLLGRCT